MHRDIKPSNLILTVNRRASDSVESSDPRDASHALPQTIVKILDFGLTLFREEISEAAELTSADQIMGTLDYMAPEQATDTHRVDIRADIYSLGATLFKLLTGELPLVGGRRGSKLQKLMALANEESASISTLRGELPASLVSIIDRMLAKDRERRFATPGEVAAALGPFAREADLESLFLQAMADEPWTRTNLQAGDAESLPARAHRSEPAAKRTARRRLFTAATVTTAVATFFLLAWGFRPWRVPENKLRERLPNPTAPIATAAISPFDAERARQYQETWAKYFGTDLERTNSIGMTFRLIPPGEFIMGSSQSEIDETSKQIIGTNPPSWVDSTRSESPQHRVILTKPIYLSIHEVTQSQYAEVMGNNPSHFATSGPGQVSLAGRETASHPVEQVSWNDASQFCKRLSERESLKSFYSLDNKQISFIEGNGYRLPTEAEWEFACRAGTETRFSCGDREEDLLRAGWFGRNSEDRTHAVGGLRPNPFGLYDMHGNVWEWCQDIWEPTSYSQFQSQGGIDPDGKALVGSRRVIRGGDWNFLASVCRSAHRHTTDQSTGNRYLGFRVALSVERAYPRAARRN